VLANASRLALFAMSMMLVVSWSAVLSTAVNAVACVAFQFESAAP
jgi:hypothetical protein